ncbi:MAG: ABC transporter ATP-binding protein [Desulfococcaceae bacterium]
MSGAPILRIEGVGRKFGKFTALADVTLSIRPGVLSALIGPNGAGKTTFYNVISGRFAPTSGRVWFKDREITGMPAHKIPALGLLRSFQITNIFERLTALENVMAPLVLHHGRSLSAWTRLGKKGRLRKEGLEILDRLRLADQAERPAAELAYGDKRLLEIAIVMARDPEMILLDEPTAGMTPEETDHMTRFIRRLADDSGITFFLTEHDMKVVFSICDYVYVLHQGRLMTRGTPAEIRENEDVRTAYLGGGFDAPADRKGEAVGERSEDSPAGGAKDRTDESVPDGGEE